MQSYSSEADKIAGPPICDVCGRDGRVDTQVRVHLRYVSDSSASRWRWICDEHWPLRRQQA